MKSSSNREKLKIGGYLSYFHGKDIMTKKYGKCYEFFPIGDEFER